MHKRNDVYQETQQSTLSQNRFFATLSTCLIIFRYVIYLSKGKTKFEIEEFNTQLLPFGVGDGSDTKRVVANNRKDVVDDDDGDDANVPIDKDDTYPVIVNDDDDTDEENATWVELRKVINISVRT